MRLQENKRYTINEMKQYLTESVESKAVAYCKKNGINIENVKSTFYKWRIYNCKYLLTLCRIYNGESDSTSSSFFEMVNMVNRLLCILSFSKDINNNFNRDLIDINDSEYSEDPKIIHDRIIRLKATRGKANVIKANDDLCAIKSTCKDSAGNNIDCYDVYHLKLGRYISNTDINFYDINDVKNFKYVVSSRLIEGYVEKYSEIYKEAVKIELDNMPKENTGRYEIIPIHNFEESESPEYSDYTTWCVTNDHGMYHNYTKEEYGDAMFYFCLRDDYEDIKPNEDETQRKALDDYGTSMFAVLVTEDNEIVQVTSRWNHNYGGGDSITDVIGLSQYLGFDARAVIQYDGEEDDSGYNEIYDYWHNNFEEYHSNRSEKIVRLIKDTSMDDDKLDGFYCLSNENGYYNFIWVHDDPDLDENELEDYLLSDFVPFATWSVSEEVIVYDDDYHGYNFIDFNGNDVSEQSLCEICCSCMEDWCGDYNYVTNMGDKDFEICYAELYGTVIFSTNDCSRLYSNEIFEEVYDKCYNDIIGVEDYNGKHLITLSNRVENDMIDIDEIIDVTDKGFIVIIDNEKYLINNLDNPIKIEDSDTNESINYIKSLNKRMKLL